MANSKSLKDILEEIKTTSDSVSNKAGEIKKTGNFVKEFAEFSIENYDQSPMKDNPTMYIGNFQSVLDNLMKVESSLDTMNSLASGISYGTASVMTALSGTLTPNSYRANPAYTPFYTHFDQIVDRGQTRDQVISAIQKLQLETTSEGKEAVNLLNSAWEVHIQGSGISTSSLIPLREAINKTIQAINKKALPQSKIKNWIIDIGNKVSYSTITHADLMKLQAEHSMLRDKLSGSKSGTYTREEERTLVREGTLHLLQILDMVDPNKLH
jgi:hypothetical protein